LERINEEMNSLCVGDEFQHSITSDFGSAKKLNLFHDRIITSGNKKFSHPKVMKKEKSYFSLSSDIYALG